MTTAEAISVAQNSFVSVSHEFMHVESCSNGSFKAYNEINAAFDIFIVDVEKYIECPTHDRMDALWTQSRSLVSQFESYTFRVQIIMKDLLNEIAKIYPPGDKWENWPHFFKRVNCNTNWKKYIVETATKMTVDKTTKHQLDMCSMKMNGFLKELGLIWSAGWLHLDMKSVESTGEHADLKQKLNILRQKTCAEFLDELAEGFEKAPYVHVKRFKSTPLICYQTVIDELQKIGVLCHVEEHCLFYIV
jgi:hypothetical protein